MDYQAFVGQMKRLAASYRVDITAPTIAAYWTVFANTDDERFAAACASCIGHERTFPTPAALKEIIQRRHESGRNDSAMLGTGSVGCLTCMDAGFIRRDLPVQHPDFGKLTPCPHCAGALKPRDRHAEALAFVKRDRAGRAPLPPLEDGPLQDTSEKIAYQLRPDEQGAHSRWTAQPPVAGERAGRR